MRTLRIPIPDWLVSQPAGKAGPVVIDADRQRSVRARRRDADCSTLHSARNAVFDRVLDHGLQNQAGNLRGKKFLGNVDAELKTLGKTHLLNVQILLGELQFLAERHLLSVGILHHSPQEVTQPDDHAHGRVVSFFAHQAGNGVERVEQEMRLDLPAQRAELGLRELLAETRRLGLLKGQLFSRIEHVVDQQDQAVEHEIGEKSAVELVHPELQDTGLDLASMPTDSATLPTTRPTRHRRTQCSRRQRDAQPTSTNVSIALEDSDERAAEPAVSPRPTATTNTAA